MSSLLTDSLRQTEKVYNRHRILLDYIALSSVTYDPTTSSVSATPATYVVRAQVEGAEALRFITLVPDSMIETFTRLISFPAADLTANQNQFPPKTGDKIKWPSTTASEYAGSQITYRVVQVFPRYINGTVINYLVSLQDG